MGTAPDIPAGGLEVRFVRDAAGRDRVYATRADGSYSRWDLIAAGGIAPHDMIHLVVEQRFGVRNGLYGLVARGVDWQIANDVANRRGGKDKYAAATGHDVREVLLSEALVLLVSPCLGDPPIAEKLARFRAYCAEHDIEAPAITQAEIMAVREELGELGARWFGLGEKGTIVLSFRP